MSIYFEKKDKNELSLTESDNKVLLNVSCEYGTIASVSFSNNGLKTVGCGNSKIQIGTAAELKGKTIEFIGTSGNPSESPIKVIITVEEENGKKMNYSFPDDYAGSPEFNTDDQEPTFLFFINFD